MGGIELTWRVLVIQCCVIRRRHTHVNPQNLPFGSTLWSGSPKTNKIFFGLMLPPRTGYDRNFGEVVIWRTCIKRTSIINKKNLSSLEILQLPYV